MQELTCIDLDAAVLARLAGHIVDAHSASRDGAEARLQRLDLVVGDLAAGEVAAGQAGGGVAQDGAHLVVAVVEGEAPHEGGPCHVGAR